MRPSLAHRAEYERRLHRVLAHIDTHLGEPIDLARLARVANFSVFHLHRIFSAHVGETLGSYLTRRRVEQAAARLASARPRRSPARSRSISAAHLRSGKRDRLPDGMKKAR